MKFLKILKQSLKAIAQNKGRSALTILGIVIGIGSVIALIALGNGASASIKKQIATLGTTILIARPGAQLNQGTNTPGRGLGPRGGGIPTLTESSLSTQDVEALRDRTTNPKLTAVTGYIVTTSLFPVGNTQERYAIVGTDPDYFTIEDLVISQGKLFTKEDVASTKKVAVLGNQVAKTLYNTNPIGKTILLGSDTYTIIGVLQEKNENILGNMNTQFFIPYTAAMHTFGITNFNQIIAQAESENAVDSAKSSMQQTLLTNHHIDKASLADFIISSPKDILSAITQISGFLTSFLAGIAAISLLVGGVGIMNIMLVSVTERTREIGLRKAVGATTGNILLQFIFEAMLLTISGGIIGILFGIGVSMLLSQFVGFTPIVTMQSILLAFGVSGIIGLLFGIYPAFRASLLNPIDALRYE